MGAHTLLFSKPPPSITQPRNPQLRPFRPLSSLNTNPTTNGEGTNTTQPPQPPPPQPPPSPPTVKPLNIRYRRRSRKQSNLSSNNNINNKATPIKKDWELMTLQEKAIELYVGEKGLLFWLNKFAYASIFIIIGGWILFRFVGPALNLYQLDAPPLPPSSVFKGSSPP
ncbi:hypothetical protein QJS10_CPA01g02357 [Acorus calamus]|uniref:Transmembrane protein n=1 Tax=Acorus calamus TaxID=4465 RepID=A0AAV9FJQ6_ACOCL|nr:hypothetical protein QJS10_CPA01g02357 [Acorus calamus]